MLAVTTERHRAGMAVHGPPPTIVSVEESLAEAGKTIVVIVGVTSDDDRGLNYIASSLISSLAMPASCAFCSIGLAAPLLKSCAGI